MREVFDVSRGLPGGFVVSNPLYEVLETAGNPSAIEEVLYEIFCLTVDLDRWDRWLDLARDGIGGGGTQEAYVKHRVDSQGRGNIEAAGMGTDRLDHLVGAGIFPVELLAWAGCAHVAGVKPDEIARAVTQSGGTLAVSRNGIDCLGIGHLGAEVVGDALYSPRKGFCAVWTRGQDVGTEIETQVHAVDREEGRYAGGLGCVVFGSEFREGKPRGPVVLQVQGIGMEILFKNGVQPFRLPIGLGMVRGRKTRLDMEAATQLAPEGRDELRTAIRDDGGWKAMKFENVIDEEVCGSPCEAIRMAGDKVPHLREAVDDDHDSVVFARAFEIRDEIDREVGPSSFGDVERL